MDTHFVQSYICSQFRTDSDGQLQNTCLGRGSERPRLVAVRRMRTDACMCRREHRKTTVYKHARLGVCVSYSAYATALKTYRRDSLSALTCRTQTPQLVMSEPSCRARVRVAMARGIKKCRAPR
eukprot:1401510-Pleurochrysis_carterae.AAC.2